MRSLNDHYDVMKRYRGHSSFIFNRHNDQDRDLCNDGMHAGMSLPHKLQCVGQSEEEFPTQQRTEAKRGLTNAYVQRLYFAQYSSLVFFAVVIQRRLEMERNGKRIFIPSVMKSMTHCYYLCKESSRCR